MLQNLVVARSKGKQFRVISGERRYRALKLLEERGDIAGDFAVKVEVRSKLGKDDALRLATVENVQRENLAPLDEAAAFASLIRKGSTLDDLCAKTGLSSTTIRRRLALNSLCNSAKAALSEGGISLSQAEALTLGNHAAQECIIDEIGRGYAEFSAQTIREHLLDERPSVAMAIFPVEEYNGTITTDLPKAKPAISTTVSSSLTCRHGRSKGWRKSTRAKRHGLRSPTPTACPTGSTKKPRKGRKAGSLSTCHPVAALKSAKGSQGRRSTTTRGSKRLTTPLRHRASAKPTASRCAA